MPDTLPDFDSLWDYNDPAATEEKFKVLLPQAEASGDAGYRAELLAQIARAQGLQQHFDEAHATLDTVEPMLPPGDSRARARYLLERGRAFNSSGAADEALPLFEQAMTVASAAGEDGFAVDAAHMVAIAQTGDARHEWTLKALRMAEESDQPAARKWLGSLHNNLGWSFHDKGDYQKALEHFELALKAREADGKPGQIQVARWCIARALRSLGRLDEALAAQQALLKEGEARGDDPDGYIYEEIAECLLALDKSSEAKSYFARAHALLSEDIWLARDEPERLERLKSLAG